MFAGKVLSWQLGEHYLLFFLNLPYEHGFAIVISQPQRALQSNPLCSTGSPSYLASCCAGNKVPLGNYPWRPNIPLGLPGPGSSVICHTQNLLSLNSLSYSQGKLNLSQMVGRGLQGDGDLLWPGRAGRQHQNIQSTACWCRVVSAAPLPWQGGQALPVLPATAPHHQHCWRFSGWREESSWLYHTTLSQLTSFSHPQTVITMALDQTAERGTTCLQTFVSLWRQQLFHTSATNGGVPQPVPQKLTSTLLLIAAN